MGVHCREKIQKWLYCCSNCETVGVMGGPWSYTEERLLDVEEAMVVVVRGVLSQLHPDEISCTQLELTGGAMSAQLDM